MYTTSSIPLIRSSIFEPFVIAARKVGVPIERHLRLARLPSAVIGEPDRLLPEIPCWRFLDSVARSEDLGTYSFISCHTIPVPELASLRPLISGSANLNQLLQRMCAIVPMMTNVAQYALDGLGNSVLFSNKGLRLLPDDTQAQLFQVYGMVQLVQLATGPNWRPEQISFTIPHNDVIENAPELNPSRILFRQRYPGIVFSRNLLPLPVSNASRGSREVEPFPTRFSEQLTKILMPYVGSDPVHKDLAAEIAGMSARTLQRRLVEEHTTYAELIDRLRLQKAQAMLEEREVRLIDISLALGYENAPSFTRAFRRWTGISPSEYRRMLGSEPNADTQSILP